MSAAALVATHLNAPYGPVVTEGDVVASMRRGDLLGLTEEVKAVMSGLFCELDPQLIVRCAVEAGVPIERVNRLYLDTVRFGAFRCPAWEQAVQVLA